ncbi:MAG: ribosome maturation factor RimM [Rhodocyclaceae bacterium]
MILLGRIVAPFGIKGWVKIQPFGDDPLAWGSMPQWWLGSDADAPIETWRPLGVGDCREHGDLLVATLEGIADRNAAEALKGLFVGAPRDALPDTEEDEYYWSDLIGLKVENTGGESLGTVDSLLSTGAHDVLKVVDGDTERLIPFVKAYVLEVNATDKSIRVDWQKDW